MGFLTDVLRAQHFGYAASGSSGIGLDQPMAQPGPAQQSPPLSPQGMQQQPNRCQRMHHLMWLKKRTFQNWQEWYHVGPIALPDQGPKATSAATM